MFLRWVPLVVFNRNRDHVIGDLVQSWGEMCGRFCAPPCLASMCCINPLYIFPSLPLSLRAFMSCSPIHVMYAFFNEKTSVLEFHVGRMRGTLVCKNFLFHHKNSTILGHPHQQFDANQNPPPLK